MSLQYWLAIVALILIPVIPQLLRLRIRFFRWIHWQWAVDVHEKYFDRLVIGIRIGLLLVAAILFYFGLRA